MGKNNYGYETPEVIRKVWQVELDMLVTLDNICKKHGLRYVIDYGTLLGAVRHEGFIPWDDDIDVSMMRTDYEKLREVAQSELPEYYFYQTAYNGGIMMDFAKIRDSRTTAIQFTELDRSVNQGVSIDIFPMDDVPENMEHDTRAFKMQSELLGIITHPATMIKLMQDGAETALPYDIMITMLKSKPIEVFRQLEEFSKGQVGTSDYVDCIASQLRRRRQARKKEWFLNPVYLKFEGLSLPAPSAYEELLHIIYGDYMKIPENKGGHAVIYDTEKPWTEYMT